MADLADKIADFIDSKLDWNLGTSEELIQLKKEMATRVVDKMQEKKSDMVISVGKDMIVDYLVDEWIQDSISDELILWNLIDVFSTSSWDLKTLREEIAKLKTQESLQAFEEKILKQIEWTWSISFSSQEEVHNTDTEVSWDSVSANNIDWTVSWDADWAISWDTTDSSEASWWEQDNESWWEQDNESLSESAQVGEAKEIELKKRMDRLFPEWIPQTEKEMKKYLTKIKVPIILSNWKTKKLTLRVHKKLSNEYKSIFEEMKNAWIRVNPDTTACFNWRKMRKSSKMSHHSYWTAIDVNWDVNGWVYWKTDQSSPYFNDQACVDIWKKHWFYWWWDWRPSNNDPMHFTYMNA